MSRRENKPAFGAPQPLMPMVGRADELAAVTVLVGAHRVVSIVGPGGIGKTRLVAEVADGLRDKHPGGVVWIDLSAVGASEVRAAWWAGLRDHDVVVSDDDSALARAVDQLGDVLVVVDNCEHVLTAATDLVELVASRCPAVRIVATSRRALELPGEATFRLGPLSVPPVRVDMVDLRGASAATALFVERGCQVRATFAPDRAEAEAVRAICRLLDGNPLAIRLAAGRMGALAPSAVLASLGQSNRVLSQTTGRGVRRHRSVADSIGWSYELLASPAQHLLRFAAVFPTTFELATICRLVAGPDCSVAETVAPLAELVENGLVEFDGAGYRLHATVRRFAQDEQSPEERAAAQERHARDAIGRAIENTSWGIHYSASFAERTADLGAAFIWAMDRDPDLMCRALAACGLPLSTQTDIGAYCDWLAATPREGPEWLNAVAQLSMAFWAGGRRLHTMLPVVAAKAAAAGNEHVLRLLEISDVAPALVDGDPGPAVALIERARRCGDSFVVMLVGTLASFPVALCGDADTVANTLTATRWACAQGGVDVRSTAAHVAEALLCHRRGEGAQAVGMLDDGDRVGTVHAAAQVCGALIALDRGDVSRLEAIKPGSRNGYYGEYLSCVLGWTRAALAEDWDLVVLHAERCLQSSPERPLQFDPLFALGAAHLRRGDTERAGSVAAALNSLVDALPDHHAPDLDARLALLRARIGLKQGTVGAANEDAHHALATATTHGLALTVVDALDIIAAVARARGNLGLAARLSSACRARRACLGYPNSLSSAADTNLQEELPSVVGTDRSLDIDAAVALARRSRGARRRPAIGRESLTPTETSVAELVAAGRTNAEVAAELFMSVATVKTHLTHTYAKLGSTNRTALAALLRTSGPDAPLPPRRRVPT